MVYFTEVFADGNTFTGCIATIIYNEITKNRLICQCRVCPRAVDAEVAKGNLLYLECNPIPPTGNGHCLNYQFDFKDGIDLSKLSDKTKKIISELDCILTDEELFEICRDLIVNRVESMEKHECYYHGVKISPRSVSYLNNRRQYR